MEEKTNTSKERGGSNYESGMKRAMERIYI